MNNDFVLFWNQESASMIYWCAKQLCWVAARLDQKCSSLNDMQSEGRTGGMPQADLPFMLWQGTAVPVSLVQLLLQARWSWRSDLPKAPRLQGRGPWPEWLYLQQHTALAAAIHSGIDLHSGDGTAGWGDLRARVLASALGLCCICLAKAHLLSQPQALLCPLRTPLLPCLQSSCMPNHHTVPHCLSLTP